MKNLYGNTKQLTAEENLVLSRRMRAGDINARTRMIEGNAGFAYKKAIRFSHKNSAWSHIDDDDLLQSALMGLIEAVDRYDPEKTHGDPPRPYAFTTYAGWWVLKRLSEEVSNTHWNTLKPPREIMRAFLYDKMDSTQTGKYIKKFISEKPSDLVLPKHVDEDKYGWSDLMLIVEQAQFTALEQRVFDSLWGENNNEDDLSDLTRGEIGDIEFCILEKIKTLL